MARIELSLSMFTLIDDADVLLVADRSWGMSSNGYAVTSEKNGGKLRLHRVIAGAGAGFDVDHRDGDRLDNRRQNIRVCTRSVNKMNTAANWPVVSKFIGVYRRAIWDRWFVMVPVKCRGQYYCGDYIDEETAARAYDSAVRYYGGKRAETNFGKAVPMDQRQLLIANGQCEHPNSRYRGVSASGGNKGGKYKVKFGTSICVGRIYKLGHFATELEAAKIYDAACLLLGVRERMNFPTAIPGADAMETARMAIFPSPERIAA